MYALLFHVYLINTVTITNITKIFFILEEDNFRFESHTLARSTLRWFDVNQVAQSLTIPILPDNM